MSRVFDALQHTRAAQKNGDNTTPLTVQDLIQKIESADSVDRKASVEPREASAHPVGPIIRPISRAASLRPDLGIDSTSLSPSQDAETAQKILEEFQSLHINPLHDGRLVSLDDVRCAASEAFRLLAVRLRHLQKRQPLQKLLITSTSAKEGKSLISANLACTLALGGGSRVLLIEGDLRCPTLSKIFGFHTPVGLCDYLTGQKSLKESVFHLQAANIWIMPAGRSSRSPIDLLNSSATVEMMDKFGRWFDWVIVDAPPALPLADTSIWERLVDGTLLVARLGTTQKELLHKGLESMEPEKLIGTVLNCSEESLQYGDYYQTSSTNN